MADHTAIIVRLKELLKTTPDNITITVIKNFIRLLEAIETQQRLIDSLRKDFSEIYALFVQILLEHDGKIILDTKRLNTNMCTDYRVIRNCDDNMIELKVMHITEEVDEDGI